jgi:diacylglycerol kinase (ATP)
MIRLRCGEVICSPYHATTNSTILSAFFLFLPFMRRKIIYLINPISGTRGKAAVRETIIRLTEAEGIAYEIIATNPAGQYQFLRQKIEEENITDVVVAGGDGSINQVVSACMGLELRIGIIPMGSGNGLAFAAKIPRSPAKALRIIFNGKAALIDGFIINNRFACMLCGLGFDAQVAHDFAKQSKRGLVTYTKQSIKNYFNAKPWPFTVTLNDKSFSTEAYFISIANSNQFGNQFTIAPKASLSDGLLDIVIVRRMSKLLLPITLLQQLRGRNKLVQEMTEKATRKNILYFQTESLQIDNHNMAPLHVDGDPADTAPRFEINIIRHCCKLLQP